MLQPGFFTHVQEMGKQLKAGLNDLQASYPNIIAGVRGRGLMLGLQMHVPPADFATALHTNKLLTAPAAGDCVIRILPPLIIEKKHITEALDILSRTCNEWKSA
jgi:acetylornithine/N-succinyldiaminopimelate aminotransferase